MPAALLVMQRNVPIRLIWMMRSKFSSGYSLISPVCLSRDTVLTEPPIAGAVDQDALLADRGARLRKCSIDLGRRGHVDLAEHAAEFLGELLAQLFVEVEQARP